MGISRADAAHLLRRSGFGVTPARLNELTKARSRAVAVDLVLDVSANPPARVPVANTDLDNQYGAWQTMVEWWLERMRTSPTPIVEKLVLFWHGHFATSFAKVNDMGVLAQQHATLRANALGDFHSLAQAVAIDPAMGYYLDNVYNAVGTPQENFARELMELFTLGIGNYTQEDVVTMARAWTGYSVDNTWRRSQYWPNLHDSTPGRLFGSAAKAWQGPDALSEIIKGSKAQVSARFIAAKLFSYFAYPVAPANAVVTPLASAYLSAGRNILALVKAIFNSSAFWSTTARYALVRTPVEWFVAGMQATGTTTSQVVPEYSMAGVGQTLFGPPDVAGWKQNGAWLSTCQMWGRSQWAAWVRYWAVQAGIFQGIEAKTPEEIAQLAFDQFGIVEPSAVTRAAIVDFCAKTQAAWDHWSLPMQVTQLMLLCPDFAVA